MTVAALYVDPNGAYANLTGVEVWDEARDARTYNGPWPVVAHPPCKRWSILGACRGYYDGADDGCFAAAVEAVRRFGGVIEHPAHSLAWRTFGLPRPAAIGWSRSLLVEGWSCFLDQALYGHRANKATWLYFVGAEPPPLRFGRAPYTGVDVQSDGGGDGRGGSRYQRSRTPPAFRDVLLALARSAAREQVAAPA